MISQRDKDRATIMLYELDSHRLIVELIPSNDFEIAERGGKVRAVMSQNCVWYRKFCSLYTSGRRRTRQGRKHDTLIKRAATRAALLKLMRGIDDCVYTDRLLDFIYQSREVSRPVDVEAIPY